MLRNYYKIANLRLKLKFVVERIFDLQFFSLCMLHIFELTDLYVKEKHTNYLFCPYFNCGFLPKRFYPLFTQKQMGTFSCYC